MKILIAEDELEILELIQLEVESVVSAEILLAHDGQQAIDFLKANPDIDFVVSDYNMPKKSGGEVFLFLKSIDHKAQFVLCSAREPNECPEFKNNLPHGFVVKPNIGAIGNKLEELIGESVINTFAPKPYIPISVNVLVKVNVLNCNIFLKLSDTKYVRIIKKGESFTDEDLNKYLKKDVTQVYISQDEASQFANYFSREITTLLAAKDTPLDVAFQISKNTLEAIQNIINSVGVTPEVQELTRKSVDLSLRILSGNKEILSVFKMISEQDQSFLVEHSLVIGYLACSIACQMGWSSESTLLKLMLASQLHDITLGSHRLSRIKELDLRRLGQLKELSTDEKMFFMSHPLQAAALAREYLEFPPEVDVIILQHHECPDGSGFPKSLVESEISPLGAVLILAHELYNAVAVDKKSVTEFCEEYPESYRVGNFKKLIAAIKASVLKVKSKTQS